ncbi:unnamed protein product [Allacma fusca]|uniref:Uncharacterized protein n=1 Tax=Allacma fusca TaxID=39272 RepID=A0A8J2KDN1_9HEXA|nr:unnamed protein product [Allacma fusca]
MNEATSILDVLYEFPTIPNITSIMGFQKENLPELLPTHSQRRKRFVKDKMYNSIVIGLILITTATCLAEQFCMVADSGKDPTEQDSLEIGTQIFEQPQRQLWNF